MREKLHNARLRIKQMRQRERAIWNVKQFRHTTKNMSDTVLNIFKKQGIPIYWKDFDVDPPHPGDESPFKIERESGFTRIRPGEAKCWFMYVFPDNYLQDIKPLLPDENDISDAFENYSDFTVGSVNVRDGQTKNYLSFTYSIDLIENNHLQSKSIKSSPNTPGDWPKNAVVMDYDELVDRFCSSQEKDVSGDKRTPVVRIDAEIGEGIGQIPVEGTTNRMSKQLVDTGITYRGDSMGKSGRHRYFIPNTQESIAIARDIGYVIARNTLAYAWATTENMDAEMLHKFSQMYDGC